MLKKASRQYGDEERLSYQTGRRNLSCITAKHSEVEPIEEEIERGTLPKQEPHQWGRAQELQQKECIPRSANGDAEVVAIKKPSKDQPRCAWIELVAPHAQVEHVQCHNREHTPNLHNTIRFRPLTESCVPEAAHLYECRCDP